MQEPLSLSLSKKATDLSFGVVIVAQCGKALPMCETHVALGFSRSLSPTNSHFIDLICIVFIHKGRESLASSNIEQAPILDSARA